VNHPSNGLLSNVTTVQRINTRGGVAQGTCDQRDSLLSVPYSALCRARVVKGMRLRTGTTTVDHLKLVLSVIDRLRFPKGDSGSALGIQPELRIAFHNAVLAFKIGRPMLPNPHYFGPERSIPSRNCISRHLTDKPSECLFFKARTDIMPLCRVAGLSRTSVTVSPSPQNDVMLCFPLATKPIDPAAPFARRNQMAGRRYREVPISSPIGASFIFLRDRRSAFVHCQCEGDHRRMYANAIHLCIQETSNVSPEGSDEDPARL
jgi:Protein of unknown function (DUF3455)